MNINSSGNKLRRNQKGMALFFVLFILGIMAILLSSNTGSLRNLNGHLKLIEEQQLKQHESRPGE
jgi:type II secretory pathway component PulK